MLRAALTAAVLLTSISAAQAYCLSTPDDSSTKFVQNSTDHLLCLQQELSTNTQQLELEARWKAQIESLMVQQQKNNQLMEPFGSF